MNLKQAVVFAILMEGNGGILNKSPVYVKEKISVIKNLEEPEILLDFDNMEKFNLWKKIWGVNF